MLQPFQNADVRYCFVVVESLHTLSSAPLTFSKGLEHIICFMFQENALPIV